METPEIVEENLSCSDKNIWIRAPYNSVGWAGAPYVEATVLGAGGPGSNPEPSGPLLHAMTPLSASLFPASLKYLINWRQKAPKIYLEKKHLALDPEREKILIGATFSKLYSKHKYGGDEVAEIAKCLTEK